MQGFPHDRGRRFAILSAATIFPARKVIDMDRDKPNMAKGITQREAPDLPDSAIAFTLPLAIPVLPAIVHQMIPFYVEFKPGAPIYEQVVYAATKSIISGQLRPGDEFPSVRALSKQLKINPNTAHKVVARLADAGLLEIRPGSVAIVAKRSSATKAERTNLLEQQFEELVVEGKRLGIDLPDMQEAIAKHWARLTSKREGKQGPGQGGRQQ